MRYLILCTVLIGLVTSSVSHAAVGKRVALVVGNAAYENVTPLANPVNDGRAIAEALRRLGFVVIEAVDQDKSGMQLLLREFARELQDADTSLFFYAGHGLQVQRRNYLVPIDATLESEIDLPFEAVAVDVVLDLMEQTTPRRLVFLDACRDNPLARRLARSAGKTRSLGVGRGLARMNNRVGTLIAFATEPDKVALDGDDGHSPFTSALLEHIETPGLEIRQMLSRVRGTVIDNTGGEQLPLDTSALVDDFYFSVPQQEPEPQVAALPEPAVQAPVAPAPATPVVSDNSTEHLFWNTIQNSSDPNDFLAYLARYPEGAFAPLARNRLTVLNAAQKDTEVATLNPTQPILPAPEPAPQPAPQPEPQAVPATPEPAPEPVVEVEPFDATMVATRNVNVRRDPNTDRDPVGVVRQGNQVAVVGKVIGANWYRIKRPDGEGEAYVYAPLFEPPAPVVAKAPEPAPAVQPAPVAQATPKAAPAQTAQVKVPAEPVQVASVAPGVAASPKEPVTRATVPAPQIDTAALTGTIGERRRNAMLRFNYRNKGDIGSDYIPFDRWSDEDPHDDGPSWAFADTSQTRLQSSSAAYGQAMRAVQVTPEMFGVLMFSQATYGGRATFATQRAADALKQWNFLTEHRAKVTSKASLVFDGVQFEVAALALAPGAPASSCFGFVAIRVNKRADGFVCKTQGAPFEASQANAVLQQIHVPRFIEP